MDEEIFKITKEHKRAESLKIMAKERLNDINLNKKTYKIVEEYYEIVKKLITAIMYLDGYKTLSHKSLIKYLERNYLTFTKEEILIADNLRTIRNNIVYYGEKVAEEFLTNKKESIEKIIRKLEKITESKLKEVKK